MLKYRNILSLAFSIAALLSPVSKTAAMPAYPKPISVMQPNGKSVTICLKGDEHLHWAQTTDGYTLLRNTEGYWSFARQDKKGNLVASDLVYDNSSALALKHGIKKNLRFSAKQMKKAPSRQNSRSEMLVDGTFPATGKHKLLLLFLLKH